MPRALIDSHIHFSSHDRLSELLRYRREIGAEKICVLSLPLKQRINFNPEILFAKAHLGASCYGLASFDYSSLYHSRPSGGGRADLDLPGQVERFQKLGFDGLKIFLGKPSFQRELGLKLSDSEVLSALKRAESLGMPVLIHIADPLVFWSYESVPGFIPPGWEQAVTSGGGSGGIPSYAELQQQAVEVLQACPDLNVIFPHLLSMGQDLSRLAEILETYPRVYLDLAPGLYFYYELDRQRSAAREFFTRYRDRVLFGTDAFWFPQWFSEFPPASVEDNLNRGRQLLRFLESEEELDNPFVPTRRIQERVRGLGLEKDTMRRICCSNFLELYPRTPRKIDPLSCLEYLDDFVDRLTEVETDGEILKTVVQLKRGMNALFQGTEP
jgi:predicted TIM-barrel fold metal-dependent hydrolase